MSVNQTQFFNNTGAQGGALAAGNGTTVDISSSVFDSNVASNGGECCTLRLPLLQALQLLAHDASL